MNAAAAALLSVALGSLAFAGAYADTNPVVNRVIVQQAVQQQMNNQLQTESQNLQMQQQQSQANLAQQMQQQYLTQQYLMTQNQLMLIELRERIYARAHSSNFHKHHPHSR